MRQETRNRVLKNTALYSFVAIVFLGISFGTSLTIGNFSNFLPYLPENLERMSVSLILIPAVGCVTFFYLAGIFGVVFEGKINQILVGSFYSAGIVSFLGFFLIMRPQTRLTGLLLMGGFAVFVTNSVFSAFSEIWNLTSVKMISRSATLFILGQVVIQLINETMVPSELLLNQGQISVVNEIVLWTFTSSSILSLFGMLKNSKNGYFSSIGSMTSSIAFVLGIGVLGSIYLSFVQGNLVEVSPVMEQLSPYIEWTGIVLLAAVVFTVMRRGMTRTLISPAVIGSWSKHVQDTSLNKGEKLTELTGILDHFILEGKKENILVRFFHFLRENRVSEEEMRLVLMELINYEDDPPPGFSVRGSHQAIENKNQFERMNVLERTVRRINSLDLPDSERLLDLRSFKETNGVLM